MKPLTFLKIWELAKTKNLSVTLWWNGDYINIYPWWHIEFEGDDIIIYPRHHPELIEIAQKYNIKIPPEPTPTVVDLKFVSTLTTTLLKFKKLRKIEKIKNFEELEKRFIKEI